jgi:hypothetical protein
MHQGLPTSCGHGECSLGTLKQDCCACWNSQAGLLCLLELSSRTVVLVGTLKQDCCACCRAMSADPTSMPSRHVQLAKVVPEELELPHMNRSCDLSLCQMCVIEDPVTLLLLLCCPLLIHICRSPGLFLHSRHVQQRWQLTSSQHQGMQQGAPSSSGTSHSHRAMAQCLTSTSQTLSPTRCQRLRLSGPLSVAAAALLRGMGSLCCSARSLASLGQWLCSNQQGQMWQTPSQMW